MPSRAALSEVRSLIQQSQHIAVITGAGVSAESGIPTFRGKGGLWRHHDPTRLATAEAFESDPSLVWEFYEYRRQVVAAAKPNICHRWFAQLQEMKESDEKKFTLMTQNVDRLHQAAGSRSVIELHGSLWLVKEFGVGGCVEDGVNVWEDRNVPITPALANVDPTKPRVPIPIEELPHKDGKLLRPAVVWFGEGLDGDTLALADRAIRSCDLFLVVGTSSVVYPAAGFAEAVLRRNVPVVEVNLEGTPLSEIATYTFTGSPASQVLPQLYQFY
ncbi:NAD-dependent protein deacylase sirtuin-5, mitochondrial [Perkinsus olseni]|uniref:NAD-dependent protein deacylase n=2 Tax=Perkinsus olseni TaxID=32597 RepID=A0A7J6S5W4_PEROL|nr:NAD-dependent protein deacylase sirtuin-5, mitochondrial [Perkinsus olseni]